MFVIDVHAHFWGGPDEASPRGKIWNQGMLNGAKALGIDRYCGLPCTPGSLTPGVPELPVPDEFRRNNRWLKEWMDRYPDLILGFAYVNPFWVTEAIAELERCVKTLGMVGVKLLRSVRCSDTRVIEFARRAGELGVPVLQHAGTDASRRGRPGESTTEDVVHLARECPRTTVIFAHVSGGGEWEYEIKALRPHPNVILDTSGSVQETGVTEMMVHEVGADRMAFGTDGSMCEALGRILGADVSDQDKERILGGTMARILGPLGARIGKRAAG